AHGADEDAGAENLSHRGSEGMAEDFEITRGRTHLVDIGRSQRHTGHDGGEQGDEPGNHEHDNPASRLNVVARRLFPAVARSNSAREKLATPLNEVRGVTQIGRASSRERAEVTGV